MSTTPDGDAPRLRDPRVDPQPGDVLDDDPPAEPLTVSRRLSKAVVAGRGVGLKYAGSWALGAWRDEMADARVVRVAEAPSLPALVDQEGT